MPTRAQCRSQFARKNQKTVEGTVVSMGLPHADLLAGVLGEEQVIAVMGGVSPAAEIRLDGEPPQDVCPNPGTPGSHSAGCFAEVVFRSPSCRWCRA